MSGSLQSHDYVPGMSGLKFYLKTGEFELNSSRITFGGVAKAPDRQLVSVEVGSYSKCDLPKNAGELLAFMQEELRKVPDEYRHAAEFEEFDASYSDESFNARLFLSYSRLETEQELADRLEKAKVVGTRIKFASDGLTISHDGVLRARLPFILEGGQVILNGAAVDAAMIPRVNLANNWSVKMQKVGSGLYAAGIGMDLTVDPARFGLTKDGQTELEKAIASGTTDQYFADIISNASLYQSLREEIDQVAKPGSVNRRLDEIKEKQGAENRAVAERLASLAAELNELRAAIVTRT